METMIICVIQNVWTVLLVLSPLFVLTQKYYTFSCGIVAQCFTAFLAQFINQANMDGYISSTMTFLDNLLFTLLHSIVS